MSALSASRCVLSTLNNPMLNGIALGLTVHDDGQIGPQAAIFPCCLAEGWTWDAQNCGYRSCSLRSRLGRVQQLLNQFKRTWPGALRSPHQVPQLWAGLVLQEIAAVLSHDSPLGTISCNQQRGQASLLWSKALAAAWRFGLETRVLNLQQVDAKSLASFTAEAEGPMAWFVEQVDKLWDPGQAEAFEYIVQRAYNAEAFIWIDMVADPSPSTELAQDLSLKSTFSRRLSKLRQQHPLDSVSRDCLSRLQSLCGGSLGPHSGDAHNA